MKQLLEFLPLVLFFGAYQMDGEIVTVGTDVCIVEGR